MAKPSLSARARNYPKSTIRGLTSFAESAQARGIEVISLNLGAPDLETPKAIKDHGIDYLQNTKAIRYGSSNGDPQLIQELVKYYSTRLGLPSIFPENILITQGASEALELALFSIADPGDTILTPDPCYANYGAISFKYGIKLSPLPTDLKHGFHLMRPNESIPQAVARLSKYVTLRTKAILWSSPGNPTGTIYSRDELEVIIRLSRKFNLFLLADEVYRLLAFNNLFSSPIPRAHSILDIANMRDRERIIVLDSASKMISFCGGRVGIITASPSVIVNLTNQASVRGCASTISQSSLSGINSVSNEYFRANRAELLSRRDFLYQDLKELHDLRISVSSLPPEGAFYLVVDLGRGIQAADYCKWLLTDYPQKHHATQTVFLTPMRMGNGGFYLAKKSGYSQVRLAYVLAQPLLERAVAIIKASLPIYKQSLKGKT